MEWITNYKYLLVPLICLVSAQLIKFLIETARNRKLDWSRLFNGNGGMPSTHSAFVSSLATVIGIEAGFKSPLFAICLVFSFIVIYDAMGVRLQAEKQAETINKIGKKMSDENKKFEYKKLKEQLGHEPVEVMMGIVVGIVISFIILQFI